MQTYIDYMVQAEIDYRAERVRESWRPITRRRRGHLVRRHGSVGRVR